MRARDTSPREHALPAHAAASGGRWRSQPRQAVPRQRSLPLPWPGGGSHEWAARLLQWRPHHARPGHPASPHQHPGTHCHRRVRRSCPQSLIAAAVHRCRLPGGPLCLAATTVVPQQCWLPPMPLPAGGQSQQCWLPPLGALVHARCRIPSWGQLRAHTRRCRHQGRVLRRQAAAQRQSPVVVTLGLRLLPVHA